MADKRRIAVESGRLVTGVIGLALAAVSIGAVGQLSLPTISVTAPSLSVTPVPSDQTRVCSGPLLRLAEDISGPLAAAFGEPAVNIGADTETSAVQLTSPDNGSGPNDGLPSVVTAESGSDASSAPLLAVAQSQTAGLDDLSGFTASACAEASAESWLVAGSSDVGRTSLIVLGNPGRADVIVDLSIYGAEGLVQAPGAEGIIVKAGEQRVFSLASFAPNLPTPVVKVATRGGQVTASLQQSSIRGLTPAGVEVAGSSASPSLTQTIPGVVIPETAPQPIDSAVYDDSVSSVRIFIPGENRAQVTISFVPENGQAAPLPIDYDVAGGAVTELGLSNLPSGTYAVIVGSSQPAVASVRSVNVTDDAMDFAWFASASALEDTAMLSVAPGPSPVLHLFNPGSTTRDVTFDPGSGADVTVSVPANGAVDVGVNPGSSYALGGAAGLHAQLSYLGQDGFSAYALQLGSPSATNVTVYPR